MRIRLKTKLNLIDNYIAIYHVLLSCKTLLEESKTATLGAILEIQKACDSALDLKNKYEKAFANLKMIDDSFLLLKKQLNDSSKENLKMQPIPNLNDICNHIKHIENDYLKLKI